MHTLTYVAIPCDEPPPLSLIREAQRIADNDPNGEPVEIRCCWGYLYNVYYSEVD